MYLSRFYPVKFVFCPKIKRKKSFDIEMIDSILNFKIDFYEKNKKYDLSYFSSVVFKWTNVAVRRLIKNFGIYKRINLDEWIFVSQRYIALASRHNSHSSRFVGFEISIRGKKRLRWKKLVKEAGEIFVGQR